MSDCKDIDLDVINATKKFKRKENESYIYVRSEVFESGVSGFINYEGNQLSIVNSFVLLFESYPAIAECAKAALNIEPEKEKKQLRIVKLIKNLFTRE